MNLRHDLKISCIFVLVCAVLSFVSAQAVAKDKTLSSDEFIRLVLAESPDIGIESANLDVSKAQASGIRINPGMVGLMHMQTADQVSHGIELYQEIPFPTKIIQDKKIRSLDYETQKQFSSLQQTMVISKARVAYIEFWAVTMRLVLLKEKQKWLRQHVEIVRATTLSDNEAKVHLLGVESDVDLLASVVLNAEAEQLAARNVLNTYAPSLKNQKFVPIEPALENPKVGELKSTFVAWKEAELKTKQARVALAKQSYVPDLAVRLQTWNGMETSQVERELMLGMTVPFLYFWQSQAKVKEANAEKAKAAFELQKISQLSESMLSSLVKKLATLKAQILVLQNKTIPRAAHRVDLMKNISTRTSQGLDAHQSVMTDYLDLKLVVIDLRVEYEKNLQEILQLTGNSNEGKPL